MFQFSNYAVDILARGPDGVPRPLKTFRYQGKTLVIGEAGQEYVIQVQNFSPERIEAVVSVDGLDVLTGKKAKVNGAGYVVGAYGTLGIEGFRLSNDEVAKFTFGDVEKSYAASKGGTASVGVIGVAVFHEKPSPEVLKITCTPPPYVPFPFVPTPPWPWPHTQPFWGPGWYYSTLTGNVPRSLGGSQGPVPDGGPAAFMYATAEPPGPQSCVAVGGDPNLGTVFGARAESQVVNVEFVRAGRSPDAVFRLYYNSHQAFVAMGVPIPEMSEGQAKSRLAADPFPASPGTGYCTPPDGWGK